MGTNFKLYLKLVPVLIYSISELIERNKKSYGNRQKKELEITPFLTREIT